MNAFTLLMKLAGEKVVHNNKIDTKKWSNLALREKRSLFTVKMHGGNILALACFPLKRGAFQTAGFKLPGWYSTTEVSQESPPPPDYLCPPEVTNWTAVFWVTLSS